MPSPTPSDSGFQIGPDMLATLRYRVFDAEGAPVDAEEQRVTFVFGYGQLLEPIEAALEGLGVGATRSIGLPPERAFGKRRPDAVLEVDREEFPPDAAPGDRFEAENEHGAVIVIKLLDVLDDRVVIDMNHPLAGQKVRFELFVEAVRPATSQELAAAAERLQAAGAAPPSVEQLLPAERLLLGGRRRYETSEVAAVDAEGPARKTERRER